MIVSLDGEREDLGTAPGFMGRSLIGMPEVSVV